MVLVVVFLPQVWVLSGGFGGFGVVDVVLVVGGGVVSGALAQVRLLVFLDVVEVLW